MKINTENERLKRRYLKYMQLAKRYSDDTICAHERAVEQWEIYTCHRDFRRITAKQAGGFSDWLIGLSNKGRLLSAATRCQFVRLVRTFYLWLATQPGRNSKSIIDAVGYLTVERETMAEANSPGRRRVPTLAYVKALADSITVGNEVDARDKALVAFLLLSGARASAVATLSLGCFDRDKLVVYQDPRRGVKTKNRKFIRTTLVPFDQSLLTYFLTWVDYLRQDKLYGDEAPLFPRTKVAQTAKCLSFEAAGIEPEFWADGCRIDHIIKERAHKAGLEPYDCHSFRHTHVQLAFSKGRSGEELKAISQNIGHEHFATTASVYSHLDEDKVTEIIGSLNFEPTRETNLSHEQLKALKKMLAKIDLTDVGE
jgi:integrase